MFVLAVLVLGFLLPKQGSIAYPSVVLSFFLGAIPMCLLFFTANWVFAYRKIKWLRILYAPRPQMSLMMLVFSAVFLLILFLIELTEVNVVIFAIHFSSFLLGLLIVVLAVVLLGIRVPVFLSTYKIDKERFEAFVGVTIACLFLNISLTFPHDTTIASPILRMLLLPLMLGMMGLVIGISIAISAEYYPRWMLTFRMLWSIAAGFLLAVSSFLVCFYFIPQRWYFGKQEMNATELFWVLQVGIASGVVAINFSELHKFLSKLYLRFLHYESVIRTPVSFFFRFLLNILLAILPLLTVLTGLLIAFNRLNVYGLAMALLMMFATIGFGVVSERNPMSLGKIMLFNEGEKQETRQLSSVLPLMLRRFFEKVFFQKNKS
ncbi:MAG: hypothetical protein NZ521_01940 [Flammeovirgaceae bacterium]|nr:hypothetical protein [Flammeovirgaceae bacterium]MDW8286867.1 hypothetical protein [Flammeovirgaceae bacterium]